MEDVTPKLLEQIQSDFDENYNKSEIIAGLYQKVRDGTATYLEANDYAIEVGKILSNAYQHNLSSAVLPDGHMYYNIANRIITPTLENNHTLISTVATMVQSELNAKIGFGIKAITPDVNSDRIKGIIEKLVATEKFDDVKWVLKESIINFSQSVVAETIQTNAEFHYDVGITGKIIRKSSGRCCEWCNRLVGTYIYPDVPKEVYQRHDFCRCIVDYVTSKERKNVHNNHVGEKRRYVKDKYGNYVLSKDARIQRAKELAAAEEQRKKNTRNKRINTWTRKNEQQYLPVKGEQMLTVTDKKAGEIQFLKIDGYNDVYVMKGVNVKPKALHAINQNINSAITDFKGDFTKKPLTMVVDSNVLGNALGKYDCVQNIIYVSHAAGDSKKLAAFQVLDNNIKMGSTEYHECWHWMQAQSYNGIITYENRDSEYMPWLQSKCLKNIESLGITEYNVSEISGYALDMFEIGRYDEVEAEYYTKKALKSRR